MIQGLEVRVLTVCVALVAGLSALSGKLISLQWSGDDEEVSTSSPGRSVRRPLLSQRGYVVDRNEEIIARNVPVTTIYLDKKTVSDVNVVAVGMAYPRAVLHEEWSVASEQRRDQILKRMRADVLSRRRPEEIVNKHLSFLISILSPRLDYGSRDELRAKIGKLGKGEIILAKNMSEDVADEIEELVTGNRLQGLRFEKSYRRWYPHPKLAPQIVGIVNHEGKGKAGIERSLADYLEGKDGYEETRRDVRDLPLGKTSGVVMPPISGLSAQLTLDLGLQAIVEDELDAGLAFSKSEKGTVVVMSPKTGEILAVASRPTFDLNIREYFAKGGNSYATQVVYEPGSTFKIVAATAAMEHGLANRNTPIFCHNKKLQERGFVVADYASFSWLSLSGVLAKSSNIGSYQLAKMLGQKRFYDFVDRFGFGQRTGVALNGEQAGLINRSGNPVDFSRVSYGYAVNVTPLQIANAYCALANGGSLMKPLLVKAVLTNNGIPVRTFEPEVIREVCSRETAVEMRKALRTVTERGGTATLAAVPGFQVAGKTGTAWRFNEKTKSYDRDRKVVSFAGMMPAASPEFVCVVVIDDPKTTEVSSVGGGSIAAPIFSKIAGRLATAMSLSATEPIVDREITQR